MAGRRQSGAIRRLPSGRYQARARDRRTGRLVPLGTFRTKADADLAVKAAETAMVKGGWVDPARGRLALGEYAPQWLRERGKIAPRTREIYASLLRVHVLPALGDVQLGRLDPGEIRRWHASLLDGESPGMAPKAYRLLRTILATAVDDELIVRNPCRIRSGGVERSPERRMASLPQLYALASAVPARYRALILLAGLTGLRTGEIFALTRANVDLVQVTVSVDKQRVRLDSGDVVVGAPKTDAGRRTIALPSVLVPELEQHLAHYVASGPDAIVFTGARGAPLDRTNFRHRVWVPAVEQVDVEGLRFHDLRHTAATLAAVTGATTKELMARLGHASPRAALIYQHATLDRDRAIADALNGLVVQSGLASLTPTRAARPESGRGRNRSEGAKVLTIEDGRALVSRWDSR